MSATKELTASPSPHSLSLPSSLHSYLEASPRPTDTQDTKQWASPCPSSPIQQSPLNDSPRRFAFEVTFLHKVYRVWMPLQPEQAAQSESPLLDSLLSLLLRHFDIQSSVVKKAVLIDVHSKLIIHSDCELLPSPQRFYYLALLRTPSSQEPIQNKDFLWRKGKRFQVEKFQEYGHTRVEELRLQRCPGSALSFMCPFLDCDKVFPRSCDLVFHFQVESDARPFKCQHCMKAFRRPYLLSRHVKMCHPHLEDEEEGGFDCEGCGRSFKQKRDFTQHWRLCSEFSPIRAQFKKTLQRAQLQSAVEQIQKNCALISRLHLMESNGLKNEIQQCMAFEVVGAFVRTQVCIKGISKD